MFTRNFIGSDNGLSKFRNTVAAEFNHIGNRIVSPAVNALLSNVTTLHFHRDQVRGIDLIFQHIADEHFRTCAADLLQSCLTESKVCHHGVH